MRFTALVLVVAACSSPEDTTPLSMLPDPTAPTPEPVPVPVPVPDPLPDPDPVPVVTTLQVDVRENGGPHTGATALVVDAQGEVTGSFPVGENGKLALEAPAVGGGVVVTAASKYEGRAETILLADVFYFLSPPAGTTLVCPSGTLKVQNVALAVPDGDKAYAAVLGSRVNQFAAPPGATLKVDLDGASLPPGGKGPLLLLGSDGVSLTEVGFAPDVTYSDGMELEAPKMTTEGVSTVKGGLTDLPAGKLAVETEVWGGDQLLSLVAAQADVAWVGEVVNGEGLAAGVRASIAGPELKIIWDGDSFASVLPVTGLAQGVAPGTEELDLGLSKLLPLFEAVELSSGQPFAVKWETAKPLASTDGGVIRLRWETTDAGVTQIVRWTIVVPPGTTSVTLPALPKAQADFLPPDARSLTVSIDFVDAVSITTYPGFLDAWTHPRAGANDGIRWTGI